MKRIIKTTALLIGLASSLFLISSCEKLLNPEQTLKITEDRLYGDWYEYRSIAMGMYGLQQNLVEQLFLLGELRGDLLNITENAEADMVEIYNFNISKSNKYANPQNFFRLIAACNNFSRILKIKHPEVTDHTVPSTNYDRLYGEALTMRAWAYFNAVRIYGNIPYIPESLTTLEEVQDFVNSPGVYYDSVHVLLSPTGIYKPESEWAVQDSAEEVGVIYDYTIELEKQLWDQDMVIDYFTDQLENEIKSIGVNHYIDNGDETWDVTIWRNFGLHALLGHMYLTRGNFEAAAPHFEAIIKNTTETLRYHLDESFFQYNWRNIFSNIDIREHIFTIWFNKAYFQQNKFQQWFEPWGPHKFMLKPSYPAIKNWESQWRNQVININSSNKANSKMTFPGLPSDFFRGMGSSYLYTNGETPITEQQYRSMIFLRADEDERSSRAIMENMDTIVFKYSINKGRYDQDANYNIYRAAGIHLYLAEMYVYWWTAHTGIVTPPDAGPAYTRITGIVNDGSYYTTLSTRPELGVRGRVGLGRPGDGMSVSNDYFIHDPYTNKIIGYEDLSGGRIERKKEIWEEELLEERALELAYEGERFYDLMRFAQRKGDPSILAKRVAAKFPANRQAEMEALLMDEYNWYIHWFDEPTETPAE
ncbi:MAG: RagB/SusD family nutrient uptake outer membrane protein [Bacteroidales bacterium]|nr:RagB/SusD family nutrient uptake outer membrane protein [Bacteroidales bacterium]